MPPGGHALDQTDGWLRLAEGGHDDSVAGCQGDHHGGEGGPDPGGQRRGLAAPVGGHPRDQRDKVHVLLGVHLHARDLDLERDSLDLHCLSKRRQMVRRQTARAAVENFITTPNRARIEIISLN